MSQPKLRRLLAAVALLTPLSWLPARPADAQAQRSPRQDREASVRTVPWSPWSLLVQLMEKAGVRIDPEGRGNRAQTATDKNEAGVRIDPEGAS